MKPRTGTVTAVWKELGIGRLKIDDGGERILFCLKRGREVEITKKKELVIRFVGRAASRLPKPGDRATLNQRRNGEKHWSNRSKNDRHCLIAAGNRA